MHHWCLKKQIKETIPSNTTIDIKVLNTQNIAQIASFAEWFCILMLPRLPVLKQKWNKSTKNYYCWQIILL